MPVRPTLAFLLLATAAFSQTSSPAPATLIDELIANADHYRTTLPSITASESIVSEASYLAIFHEKTKAEGTFRVLSGQAEQRLQESRQITSVNGKPVAPGANVHMPFTLFGGFGSFQDMFFAPAHRACFNFTLLQPPAADGTLSIVIASLPSENWPAQCPTQFKMVTGLVRVEPTHHQIVHFERTVSSDPQIHGNLAPFASVDLAPARIGDDTYWLPTEVIGRTTDGKVHSQFTAHYSNYHRYAASLTLLPGATVIDTPAASTPH